MRKKITTPGMVGVLVLYRATNPDIFRGGRTLKGQHMDDLPNSDDLRSIDDRISAADLDGLARDVLPGGEPTQASSFDNRFFNQFVNSPNFTKNI
jgi:hypothetical protein